MEEQINVVGNLILELEEAKELESISDGTVPLSITQNYGGLYTILCC